MEARILPAKLMEAGLHLSLNAVCIFLFLDDANRCLIYFSYYMFDWKDLVQPAQPDILFSGSLFSELNFMGFPESTKTREL